MHQPYTKGDLEQGEQIVRELHSLKGFDAWAERIAKALARERECVELLNRLAANDGDRGQSKKMPI